MPLSCQKRQMPLTVNPHAPSNIARLRKQKRRKLMAWNYPIYTTVIICSLKEGQTVKGSYSGQRSLSNLNGQWILPHINSLETLKVYKRRAKSSTWRGEQGRCGNAPLMRSTRWRLSFNCNPVSNKWCEPRVVPLISILDSFVELLCNNIEEIYWLY